MGVVGLTEYVCTHSCLIFIEEDPNFIPEDIEYGSVLHPTLPVDRVTRRKLHMAQDSDDLFVVHVLVRDGGSPGKISGNQDLGQKMI